MNHENEVVKMLSVNPEYKMMKEDFHETFRDAWPRIVEIIWERSQRIGPVETVVFGYDDPEWEMEEARLDNEKARALTQLALTFEVEKVDGWTIVREESGTVRIFIAHESAGPMVVRFDPK
jgi:hypothetical protein